MNFRNRIPKTAQQWLNLLIKTSKLGGFPSSTPAQPCTYLTPEGNMCAIGLLIKKKNYCPSLEGKIVYRIVKNERNYPLSLPEEQRIELPKWLTTRQAYNVQQAHDNQATDIAEKKQSAWSHEKFVESLKKCDVFKNLSFAFADKEVVSKKVPAFKRSRLPRSKQQYLNLLIKTSKAGGFPSREGPGCKYIIEKEDKHCVIGLLAKNKVCKEIDGYGNVKSVVSSGKLVLPEWLTIL